MAMKQIKVAEATGPALDWLVAKCEGEWILALAYFLPNHHLGRMNFSADWEQGGPIIGRERIGLEAPSDSVVYWVAIAPDATRFIGMTPLIAAMRCYAVSKLGLTAEVPEELL